MRDDLLKFDHFVDLVNAHVKTHACSFHDAMDAVAAVRPDLAASYRDGEIPPLQPTPIATAEQITPDLVWELALTWSQRVARLSRGRERTEFLNGGGRGLSFDELEAKYGVGDLDARREELRLTLRKLVTRGRDVVAVIKVLDDAKRQVSELTVKGVALDPGLIRYPRRVRQMLGRWAYAAVDLHFTITPADVPFSEFPSACAAVLDALERDPLLNPRHDPRSRGNPYQSLLATTKRSLARLGVSKTDQASLLRHTGLLSLTKADRRPRSARPVLPR